MTASSPSGGGGATSSAHTDNAATRLRQTTAATAHGHGGNQVSSTTPTASGLSFSSSLAFQQVKQTQASLARLCRVQQLHQQALGGGQNQSSQPATTKAAALDAGAGQRQQPQKSTTFVDCLIRRFKNCFSEDSCVVPMFVVGNLSPGSDGTHLILPPCVSLGRQHIGRFSSPKNLRLMNSIRESCRTIEELDLGDNKLTDLIEVYKIIQCMPNLRFLNLSENDLSRTSPVAMASSSSSSNSSGGPSSSHQHFSTGLAQSLHTTTPGHHHQHHHHHLSSSPGQLSPGQRACLTPINQNHQQQLQQSHSGLGVTRRHSTLGQPTSSSSSSAANVSATSRSHLSTSSRAQAQARSRPNVSRIAETRRMAATNAIAQSKKTSSSMASKLANSAAASASSCRPRESAVAGSRAATAATSATGLAASGCLKQATRAGAAGQRHPVSAASTMHLARSLSSLSAKDLRAASSRLGAHRSGFGKNIDSRPGHARSHRSSIESLKLEALATAQEPPIQDSDRQEAISSTSNKITTSTSHQKLYVEPIVETEDVDMGAEQQVSPSGQSPRTVSSTSGHQHQQVATSSAITAKNQATPASLTTTGNIGTTAIATTPPATLRSVCNTNSGLLATVGGQTTNFRRTFESIKALALNNTGCQWKVVCSILSRMPNLEELHLSLNNYEKIDLEPGDFRHPALKRLYLCNNPKLTNWEELDKLLVAFPSLQALSIADCNISQIPDNLDRAREWRKLCGLNINGWPIKEWPVVERLNQLPSLIDLKCRNLDVLNNIDEPRHHLIARLPKLQRLNGSEIEEREHAEKAFLRFFMVNSHLERPPRFNELMQIYGEVPQHVDVDVDLSPPSQARVRVIYLNRNYYRKENEDDVLMSEDFLLKLMDNVDANNVVVQQQQQQQQLDAEGASNSLQENMEVADSSTAADNTTATTSAIAADGSDGPVRLFKDDGQEVMAIEVDLRQSVRKFKTTIASLFGLKSQNLILYYIDHEMVGLMGPELIKHNQKKLWNYNVQDGDQFIVEDQ